MSQNQGNAQIVHQLSDATSLQEFLEQPLPTIAAVVTGALASGRSEFILGAGRILQAALKGRLYKQIASEINSFREKGKLKDDYAETPVGFKSLQELIEFVDSEAPDDDRLKGVQAMFYAVNSSTTKENDRIVMYELFGLAKRLSGSQIRLIAVIFEASKDGTFRNKASVILTVDWLSNMATRMGHTLVSLVELDERVLIDLNLISKRIYEDGSSVMAENARLTGLGVRFCQALSDYEEVKKECDSSKRE